jgi:hypothetical protein
MKKTVNLVKVYSCRNCIAGFIVTAFVFSFALCGIAADSLPKEVAKEAVSNNKTISKADIQTENPVDKQSFVKEMKELQNQRREISLDIYQLRVKLIKEKPSLQVLQRSIMDMHRKMAVEVNKDEQIKKMLIDAEKIDKQIVELIDKNKK